LEGARYMVAMQLSREPLVRQCVRQAFMERAKLTVRPTKKGKKEIDESHPCHSCKWLRNKPVGELVGAQFLHMQNVSSSASDLDQGNNGAMGATASMRVLAFVHAFLVV